MLEKALENKLKKRIEKAGGMCLKWVSPGFTGVPDRIAILPGKILFIEVKRPGISDGRSTRQKRVADQLRKLGCTVITAYREEDLDDYL